MTTIFEQMRTARVMPILSNMRPEYAAPLADVLVAGGLTCTEVTLRSPEALEGLRALTARGDLTVGAGTILSIDLAERAVAAGARFLVSPATNPAIVRWALDRQIPIIPGVATPYDIERALDLGLEVLKFFPSEPLGGVTTLRMYASVYPSVRFVPTGGISLEKLPPYLAFDRILATGGSWILGTDLMRKGQFDEIARLISETVTLAKSK